MTGANKIRPTRARWTLQRDRIEQNSIDTGTMDAPTRPERTKFDRYGNDGRSNATGANNIRSLRARWTLQCDRNRRNPTKKETMIV
ncbi:MAG TPA: hypothetical protein VK144_04170 [Bacillota bacterium]|nr:hypothetical protein [Bacillota bacterium]